MQYKRIYNSLILKAKSQKIEGYTETHHILPKCLGGSDSHENLVKMTPEQHYLAHQLLIKIYPEEKSLVSALVRMSGNNGYRTNKLYGWIKRKSADFISELHKGKPKSEEHKRKISDSMQGKKKSLTHRKNMSKAHQDRYKNMDMENLKMRIAETRRKNKEKIEITAILYSICFCP